jgi:uncharacterized phiE125 gp8 family phage protein
VNLRLVTPPSELPVSLSEAKAYLNIDGAENDALISLMIGAATAELDGYSGRLGRALMPQTWDLVLDCFPLAAIQVPLVPLMAVASVSYIDANGSTQTFPAERYEVDTLRGWLAPRGPDAWPTVRLGSNAVQVRFQAGYQDGAPSPIKLAILLMVERMWNMRGDGLTLRSKTVEGIGSRSYVDPDTIAAAVTAEVNKLLSPYRRIVL